MRKLLLETDEKKISASFDREEWRTVKKSKQEIDKLKTFAKNTLVKDKRINIRMSSKDLDQIQVIAAKDGVPYQTLISSIIHKFVSGYLVERKRA